MKRLFFAATTMTLALLIGCFGCLVEILACGFDGVGGGLWWLSSRCNKGLDRIGSWYARHVGDTR